MLSGELQPEVVGELMASSELRGDEAEEEAMTGAILLKCRPWGVSFSGPDGEGTSDCSAHFT